MPLSPHARSKIKDNDGAAAFSGVALVKALHHVEG